MSSTDTDSYDGQEAVDGGEKPKLSLEVKVDSPGACQRHVTVTVAREDIDRYMAEAFDELRPKAEVPGFRPGRAPRKLVEARFKEQISNQVKNSLLMDSLGQVSEEQSFSAISEPEFDLEAVSLPDEGPFTFEFDLEVRPEFDVPVWEGLRLEQSVREFTDADVDRSLQRMLKRYARHVVRETGGAQRGDALDVDLQVTREGKQLSRSENVRLELAPVVSFRDAVIEGFDQLMQGVEQGDTRETTVKISEASEQEAVQGQEVTVSFRINEIRRVEPPQLTPTFLDSIGRFEDEDDLREAVRGELERRVAYARDRRLREQITAQLIQNANWELPPSLVRRQVKRELERTVLELQSSGFSNEMIQAHANQIRQNSLRMTEASLKEHFIFERIAEDRQIEAEPEDFEHEIKLIAQQSEESPRRVRARLEKRGQMDALRNQVIERKVVALICSKAEFTNVPLEDTDEDVHAVDLALAGGHETSQIPEAKHGGEAEELRAPVDRV